MIKSIFFKECVKTRWVLLIIAILFVVVLIYSFMNISRGLRVAGNAHIWDMIVQKNITFVSYLKYVPLLAGIVLALAQYVPEMTNKRLKLTLHLPMSESKIMLLMLLFGVIGLGTILILSYISLSMGLNHYFCSEIAEWNLAEVRPWFLAGMIAYFLTAWVCIEPVWRQRIFDAIVAILLVWLFLFDETSGAYAPLLPYLTGLVILSITFSFYSLIRFKDGEQ